MVVAFLRIRAALEAPAPVLGLLTKWGSSEAFGLPEALASGSALGLPAAPGLRLWPWRPCGSAPPWRPRPRCWA